MVTTLDRLTETEGRAARAVETNRRFYDALWSTGSLTEPHRFNTWPSLSALAAAAPRRLEVGPGLRPRLPIRGTYFADVSAPALAHFKAHSGVPMRAEITALPFPDRAFDLVCAFDIVEHVDDDRQVFGEIARVARDDAVIVLSMPLHPNRWSAFDALVGHVRRYDAEVLLTRLREHEFVLEQSAVYGMEPKQKWLLDLAAWGMTRRWDLSVRWYNRYFLPIGLRRQKPLTWSPGLVDVTGVGEIALICRRAARGDRRHT
jgi:SAM-dependent methyltransferase